MWGFPLDCLSVRASSDLHLLSGVEGLKEEGITVDSLTPFLFIPHFDHYTRHERTLPSRIVTMAVENWEREAQKGRDILQNSIPQQWLASADQLPPPSQKNVADFPKSSGLLSERDLQITDLSATALVADMGAGKLTAEETVVAFLKRAVLGHQLVGTLPGIGFVKSTHLHPAAELCDRIYGG